MHLRQVALVARDLEPVAAELCEAFGLEIALRDPGVAEFGLHNAVMPVGSAFLEVVSPVREGTTAGRFLAKRGGDGGYMVILQTDDLAADRQRLARLGVRIVWEVALDDIATIHLHPRDIGGAIVSLDQPRPATSWRWAGPGWETKAHTGIVRGITSVTLAAPDPGVLAARWAEVLGLGPPRRRGAVFEIALDPGVIRVAAAARGSEGLVAIGLGAVDAERALANAERLGLRRNGNSLWSGGIRFDLE
jgi:hypothetical protein